MNYGHFFRGYFTNSIHDKFHILQAYFVVFNLKSAARIKFRGERKKKIPQCFLHCALMPCITLHFSHGFCVDVTIYWLRAKVGVQSSKCTTTERTRKTLFFQNLKHKGFPLCFCFVFLQLCFFYDTLRSTYTTIYFYTVVGLFQPLVLRALQQVFF